MTRNKKLRIALAAMQIKTRYRLSGTGARPGSFGYYQVVRTTGKRQRTVAEGETPYQATARAFGHARAARLDLPGPSWAVISIEL